MAKQTINNGDSGLSVRNKINSNFSETYNLVDDVTNNLETHTLATNPHNITPVLINASPLNHIHNNANGIESGFSDNNFTNSDKSKVLSIDNKLEVANIIAGTNITLSTLNNDITISSTGSSNNMLIKRYDTKLDLPVVGDESFLYMITDEFASYIWSDTTNLYYCVGRDFNEINIINGGNA